MKTKVSLLWERIHESYWFYPGLLLAAGGTAALGLTAMDERLGDLSGRGPLASIYSGGADGARAVLGAIATAVLAVAGTTFSITVAILSLTTSQFGPRLLRNFLRDTPNQVVLGTFIATFLYCLLVMRTVRSIDESSFVPHISVSVGVGLGVVSAAMLVYFIHHIVTTIQAANFIEAAGRDLLQTLERLYPEQVGTEAPEPEAEAPPAASPALPLSARRSGYVQAFEGDELLALARDAQGVLELRRAPGNFVAAGTVLALLHGAKADAEDATARLDAATALGPQPTEAQDPVMPVDQLAEIAMRALSSGINDPNTAIMCIDRLTVAFCVLAGRRFPSRSRFDEDGTLRVLAVAPSFADVVNAGFDPIRRYGRHDVRVLCRLIDALENIASCSDDPGRRRDLAGMMDLVLEAGRDGLASDEERALLERCHGRARGRSRG